MAVRQEKTGVKMMNQSEPRDYPVKFPDVGSRFEAGQERSRPVRPAHERRVIKEDDNQFNEYQHGRNERPLRSNAGSDHSIESSPLHQKYEAKISAKGSGSSSGERKNMGDSSHGADGRSRKKPTGQGHEATENSPVVPKFGAWDDNNASASENYSDIFSKIRKERAKGPPMISVMDVRTTYATDRNQKVNDKKGCCFPWFRK